MNTASLKNESPEWEAPGSQDRAEKVTRDNFSQRTGSVNGEGGTPFGRVLARLDGGTQRGGEFIARCPAHEDTNPSLTISEAEDGKVLLHCFAGCSVESIVAALGLTMLDLFPAKSMPRKKIVELYHYTDEAENLLYQVVRFEPKDFRQRRPDGHGGWLWDLKDTRRVLYRLSALRDAEVVFICEGEKDCDRLREIGLVATTNAGGAGRWREEYAQFLANKHVVILPDNDTPGEEHTLQVARSLLPVAATAKIVRLPDLPAKGDVSDWLGSGHSKEDLLALVEATAVLQADETRDNSAAGSSPTGETKDPPVGEADFLKAAIRGAILDVERKGFDKKRDVAELVCNHLKEKGTLYRTPDGRLFFFSHDERRLYDIEQRAFAHLLIDASGLSSTETFFHFMFDTLTAHVSRHADLVEVHTLAHYQVSDGVLTISDGGGGVWRRECNGQWELGKNGDDGILFLTEPDVTPWRPEFSEKGNESLHLKWFLQQVNFSSDPLSIERQRAFLTVWLLHQFFPSLRRTRTVPAWLGPQGAGKSTTCRLIGRLLIGDSFDVSGIRKEREDAFVAAITNRVVHAIDNADTRIDWLEDALARYATGEVFRLRRLYTTNEEVTYRPRAILMLTSRDPHFQRPDVAQRLLPFHLQEIEDYLDEPSIFRELATRRNAIWGDLLSELAEVQDSLHKSVAPRLKFRMADYASFGWQVFQAQGQADEWIKALTCLDAAQMRFAAEGDGLILALGVLLEGTDSIGPLTIKELYGKVIEIADSNSLAVPKTAEWFGRKLTSQKRVIESELNVTLLDERGHERKRRITIKKKKVS